MKIRYGIAALALALTAWVPGDDPGMAQSGPAVPDMAIQSFAFDLGSLLFSAGQLVIVARACGEAGEAEGLEIHKLAVERAQQCAAADPRLNEVVENMNRSFNFMLDNAGKLMEARGREALCARYRASDLPADIATALEVARSLRDGKGQQRIAALACPEKK